MGVHGWMGGQFKESGERDARVGIGVRVVERGWKGGRKGAEGRKQRESKW